MEIAEIVTDKLICESCGKEFSCGAKVGECWCFAVDLQAETLAELREEFTNCLCQNCLSKKTRARDKSQTFNLNL